MNIKLTRKQELRLIQLGLDSLLGSESNHVERKPRESKKTKERKWTNTQRKKFSATMRRKWKNRQLTAP
jgi:hypothetical protein